MKKILGLVVAVGLAIGLSACSKAEKADNLLATIQSKKKIIAGTNSGYPPYEFFIEKDGKKKLVGVDVDLGNLIAKELGVEIEFQDMDFDALVPSAKKGSIDIVLAGMVDTKLRRESIDFSIPYSKSGLVAVMKKDDVDKYNKVAKLDGKTIAVQVATTQEQAANSVKNAKVMVLPTIPDMVTSVKTGKAEVLFVAEFSADSIVAQHSDLVAVAIDIDKEHIEDGASIGIPKNQPELLAKINELIKKWQEDGTIDKIKKDNSKLANSLGN